MQPTSAKKFFWRGLELHRASYATLVDAFKQHCGKLDWEAEILAYDVYTIVEVSHHQASRLSYLLAFISQANA
jgi:hypothetical protein